MRKAAGILMIIVGVGSVYFGVGPLIHSLGTGSMPIFPSILYIVPGAFLIIGGRFCLWRRHWKLCFASALLPVVIMIFEVLWSLSSPWLSAAGFLVLPGVLLITAIVFLYLRRREWPESQA